MSNFHFNGFCLVVEFKKGTDTIEGIVLDMPNLKQEVQLKANTFDDMKRLRILIVRNGQVSGAPQNLPNNLRLLEWNKYPLTSLPDSFHPKTLVVLNLPKSHITMDEPFKVCNLSLFLYLYVMFLLVKSPILYEIWPENEFMSEGSPHLTSQFCKDELRSL